MITSNCRIVEKGPDSTGSLSRYDGSKCLWFGVRSQKVTSSLTLPVFSSFPYLDVVSRNDTRDYLWRKKVMKSYSRLLDSSIVFDIESLDIVGVFLFVFTNFGILE